MSTTVNGWTLFAAERDSGLELHGAEAASATLVSAESRRSRLRLQ
jgi:hypothetical protein